MLERIHHALYGATREHEGREVSPIAAIIDSQRAKAAQKGTPLRKGGPCRTGTSNGGVVPRTQYPARFR